MTLPLAPVSKNNCRNCRYLENRFLTNRVGVKEIKTLKGGNSIAIAN